LTLETASRVATVALTAAAISLLFRHTLIADRAVPLTLQGLAVALMAWARWTLGRRSFHAAASPTEGGLVTTGTYRLIRHPIYSSILVFLAGALVCYPSVWSGAAVGVSVIAIAIRIGAEERLVRARYPEHAAYATRTKLLVPFIL